MTQIEREYIEIKKEIVAFVEAFTNDKETSDKINKYYAGVQVLFTPLIKQPTFMFIGINPGMGFAKHEKRKVKRFKPLQNCEYAWGEYTLAKQSRRLFELADIPVSEMKNTVKSNCFFFATKSEKELYPLLSHLKRYKVYPKSEKWINQIVQIVAPKIIICEGKSAFDRFTKNKDCQFENTKNVLYAQHGNMHIIGYKRTFSNIRNINEVAQLLKSKAALSLNHKS